jgi:hypothetical protein
MLVSLEKPKPTLLPCLLLKLKGDITLSFFVTRWLPMSYKTKTKTKITKNRESIFCFFRDAFYLAFFNILFYIFDHVYLRPGKHTRLCLDPTMVTGFSPVARAAP